MRGWGGSGASLLCLGAAAAGCGPPADGELLSARSYMDVPGGEVLDLRYGSDGLRVQGMLAVPDGDGPFPLVLFNHGGFDGMRDDELDGIGREAVARGVAVAAAMYRGEGESEGEVEYCLGEVDDVLNMVPALDGLVQTTGDTVAMGSSHGACISLMVNSRTDLLGTVTMGTPTEVKELMDWHYEEGDPDHAARWEPYVRGDGRDASPVYADVRPPIALVHGMDDDIVPLFQACLLYDEVAPSWPVGSYRLSDAGEPLAPGPTDDCQAELQAGDPWAAETLGDGLTLISWEGVPHKPTDAVWTAAWDQASRWMP